MNPHEITEQKKMNKNLGAKHRLPKVFSESQHKTHKYTFKNNYKAVPP